MSSPKGYSSQEKDDRLKSQFTTVESIRQLQHGLSVLAHMFVYVVGSDAAEANSTTYVINATAHAALVGDVIRFTSGTFSGREVKVHSVATNTITLAETLASAVATGVTFQILRHKYPVVDSAGLLSTTSGPIKFTLDGADQVVTEDTVTPANNAPLPVKLTGATGDINITAGDLNVQLSHAGANYDSTRIGDGTELLSITASGQAEVAVTTALPAGTNNIGDVDVLTQPARSHTTDSTKVGDGVDFLAISAAGAASVEVTSALPAGTNNIGDVDVLTLPSIPAGTNNIGDVDVLTLPSIPAGTNNIGDVDVLTMPATVANAGALPSAVAVVAGYDGANVRALLVTSAGRLAIDSVVSLPLPSGASKLTNQASGQSVVTTTRNDYSSVNVTTGAWVQLIASTSAVINSFYVFDSSGQTLELGIGAAASETRLVLIPPGGNDMVPVKIAAGTRVSIRAVSGTASTGELDINWFGEAT